MNWDDEQINDWIDLLLPEGYQSLYPSDVQILPDVLGVWSRRLQAARFSERSLPYRETHPEMSPVSSGWCRSRPGEKTEGVMTWILQ